MSKPKYGRLVECGIDSYKYPKSVSPVNGCSHCHIIVETRPVLVCLAKDRRPLEMNGGIAYKTNECLSIVLADPFSIHTLERRLKTGDIFEERWEGSFGTERL